MASSSGNTDVLVYHGSTDAPVVDIHEKTAGELVNDLAYSDFSSSYLELATADYILEVRDGTGSSIVASYSAPLSTLGLEDSAIVVVASGFLAPSGNSDGPAFGLYTALPSGGALVELPLVEPTSITEFENASKVSVYPNPATTYIYVALEKGLTYGTIIEVYNMSGKKMLAKQVDPAGLDKFELDVSMLQRGMYLLNVKGSKNTYTTKFTIK
jgi:hypothetical protein